MTTERKGLIEIVDVDGIIFTDSKRNDFVMYTETSNQNILIGPLLSNVSAFAIRSNNVHISNRVNIGGGSNTPSVALEINTTDSLLIPKGTTAQRPAVPQQGYMRYNTSINTFEGYGAGNAWGSLGGVKDTNQDTYISAESFPTSNDDILRFYTSNNEVMRIGANGFIGVSNQAPSERLDVAGGNAKFGSNIYVVQRAGIANSNPTEALDIVGNMKASSNIYAMTRLGVGKSNTSEVVDIVGNTKISNNTYVMSNLGVGTSNPSVALEVNGSAKVNSNLEVVGNITVRGTTTTVDSTTVNIVDNIIRLNNGAAFNSSMQAGIEVNRGTGLSNYYFVFDEASDFFKVGMQGGLQVVATRDDALPSNAITFFDASNLKYTGCNDLVYNSGRLGVGNSAPAYKVDITGATLIRNGNIANSSANSQFLLSYDTGSNYIHSIKTRHDSSSNSVNNAIDFYVWQTSDAAAAVGTKQVMSVTSAGVGIGTTTPAALLDVAGTTMMRNGNGGGSFTNNQVLFSYNLGSSYSHAIKSRHNASANDFNNALDFYVWQTSDAVGAVGTKQVMSVTSAGLGVGTTTPNESLHVESGKIYSAVQVLGQSNDSASVPSFAFKQDSNTGIYHPAASTLGFTTAGTERVRIDNTGNVGIGGTPGSYKLDVFGISRLQNVLWMNNQVQNCVISLYGDTTSSSTNFYGLGIANGTLRYQVPTSSTNHIFYSSNTEIVRIQGDGKVGINTISPTETLQVTGKVYASTQVLGQSNDSVSAPSFAFKQDSNTGIYHPAASTLGFVTGGTERMMVGSNGNIGIGTSSPSYVLDVNGNSRLGYTYNLHSNWPYGVSTTNRRYALIASLITNNGFANFKGWCAGHDVSAASQGQCSFDLIMNGRGWFIKGNCHNTANVLAGLVVYLNSSTNTLDVYLTGGSYLRYVIAIQGEGLTVPSTITWSADTAWATPANSTLIFDTVTNIPINSQDTSFYMTTALTPIFTTTRMISGNVGIGNSNPTEVLEVTGKIYASTQVLGQSNDSATIPSFAFKQDSNTGMYHAGTSTLGFVTGGAERMRIGSTGNIGIGNSNPAYTVDVSGTINATTLRAGDNISLTGKNLFINSTAWGDGIIFNGIGSNMRLYYQNAAGLLMHIDTAEKFNVVSTGSAYLMTVLGTGNVGINITTPSERLHVAGKVYSTTQFLGNGADSASVPSFAFKEDSNTGIYHAGTSTLGFVTSGAERMRITSGGNVGIGVTNPTYSLAVSSSIGFGSGDVFDITNEGTYRRIQTFQGAPLSINPLGNFVGIGTTTPSFRLHNALGSVFIGDIAYASNVIPATVNTIGTANGYRLVFDNSFNGTTGAGTVANKIVLHNNTTVYGFGVENNALAYHSGCNHNFYTGAGASYGTLRATITPTGLGIGTGSPSVSLEVNGSAKVNSNLEVVGNLTIRGTTTTVDSTTVNITDNIIRLNNGAAFSSSLQAGIEVNRGTGLSNYYFVFDEASDYFKVGMQGGLQAVATRDDTISSNSLAFFDSSNLKYTGCNDLVYNGGNLGIGTSTPGTKLEVVGQVTMTHNTANGLVLKNTLTSTGAANEITFDSRNMTGGSNQRAAVGMSDSSRNFYIWVNGSDRMNITNSGNVGIGTVTPSSRLGVTTSAYGQGHLMLSGYSHYSGGSFDNNAGVLMTMLVNQAGNRQVVFMDTSTSNQSPSNIAMRMGFFGSNPYIDCVTTDGSTQKVIQVGTSPGVYMPGNVGVATTPSTYALDVNGAAKVNSTLYMNDQVSNCVVCLWRGGTPVGSDTAYFGFGINSGVLRYQANATGDHAFYANTSELMRIRSGGNVGIGTSSPGETLHVETGKVYSAVQILGQSNDSVSVPSFAFKQDSNTGMYHPAASTLGFVTGGTERMRVASDGSVMVRNTAALAGAHLTVNDKLFVGASTNGGNYTDAIIHIAKSSAAPSMTWEYNNVATGHIRLESNVFRWVTDGTRAFDIATGVTNTNPTGTGTSLMRILGGGNVGIGTITPSNRLEVVGNILASSNVYAISRIGVGTSNPTESVDIIGNTKILNNLYVMSNVGVGTSNPSVALEVNGSAKINSNLEVVGNMTVRGTTTTIDSTTVNIVDNIIRLNNGAAFNSSLQAGVEVNRGAGNSNYYFVFDEATDYFKVGMQGGLQAVATRDDSLPSNAIAFFDSSNLKYTGCNTFVYVGGNVGIGTTTPAFTLDVAGTALARNGNIANSSANNQIVFAYNLGSNYLHSIKTRHDAGANSTNNAIDFYVWQTTDSAAAVGTKQVMSVTSAGVGIGTTTPTENLDVLRNMKVSSNMYTMVRMGVANSNPTEALDVTGNMKVSSNMYSMARMGVANSNPTEALDVTGNIKVSSNMYSMVRMGVANSNPTEALDVTGNMKVSSNMYTMARMGVATSNPGYSLHVIGAIASSNIAYLGNGTETAPTISWSNDTDTGIYRVAENTLGFTTGGSNAMVINRTMVGINNNNPDVPLDVIGNVRITSNILFGSKSVTYSNKFFPTSSLGVGNPTGTLDGVTYTFANTNIYGNFNGNWFYDYDHTTNLGMDGYTNGIFTGVSATSNVDGSTVIRGQYSGITGSSNFVLRGYRFEGSNVVFTTYPKKIYVLGSYDSNNWTTVDYYTVASSANYSGSNQLNTNVYGLDRQFDNLINYRYYRVVFNELLAGTNATITEFRWYIGSPLGVGTYNTGLYYNVTTNNFGINTSNPQFTYDVSGTLASSNIYASGIGSANLPSYTWRSASNTGMYLTGQNQITFATTSSNIVTLSNLQVGISTQTPSEKLDVVGNLKVSSNIYVVSRIGIANSNPTERLDITGNAKVSLNMYVMSNMGIGTSNPLTSLDVNGIMSTRSTTTPEIRLINSNTSSQAVIGYATTVGQYSTTSAINDLVVRAEGTTGKIIMQNGTGSAGLLVNSNNYVGILTGMPTYALHVGGKGYFEGDVTMNSNLTVTRSILMQGLRIRRNNGTVGANFTQVMPGLSNDQTGNSGIYASTMDSNFGVVFWVGLSNEVGRFSGNMRFAVGTSNPSEKMDIAGGNAKIGSNMYVMSRLGVGTSNVDSVGVRIYETTGTNAGPNAGSLVIQHGNGNGISSISFPSANNNGSDYGYISFYDTVQGTSYNYFSAGNAEAAAIVIGVENDGAGGAGPDSVVITPAGNVAITPRSSNTYIAGNVGIGYANPSYNLHVASNIYIQGAFMNSNYLSHGRLIFNDKNFGIGCGSFINGTTNDTLYMWRFDGTARNIAFCRTADGNTNPLSWTVDMLIQGGTGNVGIGLSNPSYKLDVSGNARVTSNLVLANGAFVAAYQSGTWIDLPTAGPSGIGSGGIGQNPWVAYAAANGQYFVSALAGDICYRNTSGRLLLGTNSTQHNVAITSNYLYSSNSIGIGATNTANALTVSGGAAIGSSYTANTAPANGLLVQGNVGIGLSNPTQMLSVNGSIFGGLADNTAFGFDGQTNARLGIVKKVGFLPTIASCSGQPILFGNLNSTDVFTNISTSTLTELMRITSNGFVGIGTSAPSFKLHNALGSVFIGDIAYASNVIPATANTIGTANGHRLVFDNSFNGTTGAGTVANKIVLHNNTNVFGFGVENNALAYHSGCNHNFYTGAGASYGTLRATITPTGLGIGTGSPSFSLEVNGSAKVNSNLEVVGNLTVRGTTTTVDSTTVTIADNIIRLNNGAAFSSSLQAGMEINRGTGYSNYYLVFDEASDYFKVGMTGALQTVATRDDTLPSNAVAFFDSSNLKYTGCNNFVYAGGNVGIGTNTPGSILHIKATAMGSLGPIINLQNDAGSAFNSCAIDFNMYSASGPGTSNPSGARISAIEDGGWGSHLIFSTKPTGSASNALIERMRMGSTGNVGIGTSNPETTLDVNGTLRLTNNVIRALTLKSTLPDANAANEMYFDSTSMGGGSSNTAAVGMSGSNRGFYVLVNGSDRLSIASSGNVGVNTPTPTERFHVTGNMYATSQVLGNTNDSSNVPSFSFKEDSNTGMYHPGASNLGFVTGGTERVRITSSGNVGIGYDSPGVALFISRDSQLSGTAFAGDPGQGQFFICGGTNIDKRMAFLYDTTTDRAYIQSVIRGTAATPLCLNSAGGNVGVGTSNPESTLDVNGTTRIRNVLYMNNQVQNCVISIYSYTFGNIDTNATNYFGFGINAGILRYQVATGGDSHVFYQSNVELMRIAGNGNIGIGTASPGSILHIKSTAVGTLGPILNIQNDGGSPGASAAIDFNTYANIGPGTANPSGARIMAIDDGNLSAHITFSTKSPGAVANALAERIRILSGGNVGIGVTSPNVRLEVAGSVRVGANNTHNKLLALFDTNPAEATSNATNFYGFGVNPGILRYQIDNTGNNHVFYAGGNELMRIKGDGNVGIGTASPGYKLEVAGAIYASGDITAMSDARIKENIQPIDDALTKLNMITGYTYTRKDADVLQEDVGTKHIGLIAQEVKEVLPEVVSYDKENDRYGVQYGNIVAVLIQAVKELKGEVDMLRNELRASRT